MTIKHNVLTVRKLLRENPDGLTAGEVVAMTGMVYSSAYNAMDRQPDVYIDRWEPNKETFRWAPVFCLIQAPEDAPKPRVKVLKYMKAAGMAT